MSRDWHSMREMMNLQDRLNRLFTEAGQEPGHAERDQQVFERVDWRPAADVYERGEEFMIELDLPGINRQALEIDLDENRLTIRGERKIETEGEGRTERPTGRFLRRFGLPATIDQSGIAAEYKDGVLRVRLPKRKEQKARRIEVKVR